MFDVEEPERSALITFCEALFDLSRQVNIVNPIRPIASGILDMTGVDIIWLKMMLKNGMVGCLSLLPDEYTSISFPDAVDEMCWVLMNNCGYATKYGGISIIKPISIPSAVDREPDNVILQVYAAHALLENL